MNEAEKWDRVAGNYQEVFSLGLNDYNSSLLRFWKENGMLPPGARVLDIGCGVGKYGMYLAEMGYEVTLTDISGEMLRHAAENMAKVRTPWMLYRCDFGEATGKEPVFAGGFDLVISTMSPAVHDAATVRKMSKMSRKWCFMARFRDWKQPFRDRLMEEMGIKTQCERSDLEGDVLSMIRAVKEAGYAPLVKTVDYCWSDQRTPEQMADYLHRRCFSNEAAADRLRDDALKIVQSLCGPDGCVEDAVNTKVAWIYWKTEDKT